MTDQGQSWEDVPGRQQVTDLALNTNVIRRPDGEVDELMNRCADAEESGESAYKGKIYEAGIAAGIAWLLGQTDDHPLDD